MKIEEFNMHLWKAGELNDKNSKEIYTVQGSYYRMLSFTHSSALYVDAREEVVRHKTKMIERYANEE